MSEFSPFSAEMSNMELAVTKSRIKDWRHRLRLPGHNCPQCGQLRGYGVGVLKRPARGLGYRKRPCSGASRRGLTEKWRKNKRQRKIGSPAGAGDTGAAGALLSIQKTQFETKHHYTALQMATSIGVPPRKLSKLARVSLREPLCEPLERAASPSPTEDGLDGIEAVSGEESRAKEKAG